MRSGNGGAAQFQFLVRLERRIQALSRHDDGYLLRVGNERYTAKQVVMATGPYHHPHVPGLAAGLDPTIAQLYSSQYRNPGQLPAGDVLVPHTPRPRPGITAQPRAGLT